MLQNQWIAFPILEKEFSNNGNNISLLKQKGFYPYEYIDSIDRLQEKELPGKEKFYSTLTQKTITDSEYSHAQKVWETYNCNTLLDYHNLYLKNRCSTLGRLFREVQKLFPGTSSSGSLLLFLCSRTDMGMWVEIH